MTNQLKYLTANITGLPAIVKWKNRNKLLVLTYHGIYDGPRRSGFLPETFVHIEEMVNQLKELKKKYYIIDPNELLGSLENNTPLPFHAALITFDDGYESFYRLAHPALKSLEIQAIVFVPTHYIEKQIPFWFDLAWIYLKKSKQEDLDWILDVPDVNYDGIRSDINPSMILLKMKEMLPEQRDVIVDELSRRLKVENKNSFSSLKLFYSMNPEEIRGLSESGATFGGHTDSHTILSALPFETAEREIKENKEILENLLDRSLQFFAYPNGGKNDFNNDHKDILKDAGYKAAFSLTQNLSLPHKDPMEISRINVVPEDTIKSLFFRCTGITPIINNINTFLKES